MKSFRQKLRSLIVALLLCGPAGCISTKIPGASRDLLAFLQEGATTREAVLFKLGQPSAGFEHERILTYRIGEDSKQGYYVITPKAALPWQQVRYSLVLAFDDQGLLRKHTLVPVQ